MIEGVDLATSTSFSLTESVDFSSSNYYEGVNVNTSLYLCCLKNGHDFESGSFGPEWRLAALVIGIQSSTVISGSQTAKAGTQVDQETSLTLDVSAIPAGSGTFQYQVSSESGFDYLIF